MRPGRRTWAAYVLLCLGLLGQGEKFDIDVRFDSPISTLVTYWDALRANDAGEVWECFDDPGLVMPVPGMLWFLPPSDRLGLYSLRFSPVEEGRVLATYEVRFHPRGSNEELRFIASTELVRKRGEWRLAQPVDEVAMPSWRAIPRSVDI